MGYVTDPTNEAVRDCIEISAQKSGALGQNFLAWTQYGKVNLHDALLCEAPPEPNSLPTALFNSSITGLNVDFTDRSQDSDGSLVSWSWDFGDGSTATEQNPTHAYAAGGTYSVKLTVTDDAGDSAEFIDDVVTIAQICADDEDSDGVPDTDDNCPGTPANTPVNPKGCTTNSKKP